MKTASVFSLMLLSFFLFSFGCNTKGSYEATHGIQRMDCYQLHESEQARCLERVEKMPSYEAYTKEREAMIHKKNAPQ
ncbi:hypothetical protein [Desulfobotulus sp.]|uniref:hypothetical protein n=1 Tax=Desulfobotulus sp. TaxID=1940337 RepID=UPI002A36C368|nr:hypothetical protein [Desulfobotulus sp.]MDY0162163.1 hypothetical protein [Desulfobotulus sp.]